jgi:hypothetical protein
MFRPHHLIVNMTNIHSLKPEELTEPFGAKLKSFAGCVNKRQQTSIGVDKSR